MGFKFLEGGVEELMGYTGVNTVFIANENDEYLIYIFNKPYNLVFYSSTKFDPRVDGVGEIMSKWRSNYLAIKNPKYIDMEKYISEYKHLIGCEFVGSPKGKYVNNIVTNTWAISKNEPSLRCNFGYLTTLSRVKFYTEDGELVTYEEYMELYYPEYRHVWEKQL